MKVAREVIAKIQQTEPKFTEQDFGLRFGLLKLKEPDDILAGLLLFAHSFDTLWLRRVAEKKGKSMADAFSLVQDKIGGFVTLESDTEAVKRAVINVSTDLQD